MLEPLVINLREHVLTCTLCHAKGFICEICMNEKEIIFPFDLETTSVCQGEIVNDVEIDRVMRFDFIRSLSIMFSLSMS